MKLKHKALIMSSILALSACDLESQDQLQEDSQAVIQNESAWNVLGVFASLNPITGTIFGLLDIFATSPQPDFVALLNQAVSDIKMTINQGFMTQAINAADGALETAAAYKMPCRYPNGAPQECTNVLFTDALTNIGTALTGLNNTRGNIKTMATPMLLVANLVTTSNVLLERFMLNKLVTYPNSRKPRSLYLSSFSEGDLAPGSYLAQYCNQAREAVEAMNTVENDLRAFVDSNVSAVDRDRYVNQIQYCRTSLWGEQCSRTIPLSNNGTRRAAAAERDRWVVEFKAAKFQELKDQFMGGFDQIRERLIMRSRCEPSVPFPATGQTCFGANANVLRRGDKVAVMQGDGNFVVYQNALPGRTLVPLWSSSTHGVTGRKLCLHAGGMMTITNANGTIARHLSQPNPAAKMFFLGAGGGLYIKNDGDAATTVVTDLRF